MTKSNSKMRAAVGLKPSITLKSQRRRKTQAALTEISAHGPTRRNDPAPELYTLQVPIDSLTPASRRIRRSEKTQAVRLDASIAEYGQVLPILVDVDDRIVHGHGVYEALKRAGAEHVTISRVTHLPPPKLRSLAIALNRLGETGTWDEEALKIEFSELIDLGEDPVVTGFEIAEIDGLLLESDDDESADEEGEALDPPNVPTSRPGDLWRLGAHLLLQGDALEVESYKRLMAEGEAAQLLLADAPFNVAIANHVSSSGRHREFAMASGEMNREEFFAFLRTFIAKSSEHLVDGAMLMIFMDWRSIETLLTAGRELGLSLVNLIAWVKSNGGQGSLWRSQHELIAAFKKGGGPHRNNIALGRWGRWRSNAWHHAGASSLGSDAREGLDRHPTPKPRALLEDALLDVTNLGDIVLDPFAGSGTTIIAAEATRRVCRAIEIDSGFCDVSILRWQALTGEQAILAETKEPFAQVAARRAVEQEDASQHRAGSKSGAAA